MKTNAIKKIFISILAFLFVCSISAFALANVSADGAQPRVFKMNDGASIRLVEDSNGIRFSATLSEYDVANDYGFVIVPKAYVVDNNITGEYVTELNALAEAGTIVEPIILYSAVQEENGENVIKGSIANILYENINLEFVGIGFEYDGTDYNYASFDSLDDISRTAPVVAASALNELYYDANIDADTRLLYQDAEDILKKYINESINKNAGLSKVESDATTPTWELAFTSETVDVEFGKTAQLSVSTNLPSSDFIYSSNSKVITVNENGLVTANGVGSATITVKCLGVTATCTVNVANVAVADGYVVDFNDTAYASHIEGGAHQGFWKADAVSTEYVASDVAGAKDGDALKVTVDIAPCRTEKGMSFFTINFLANKSANLTGDVLQIRFRATYNDGANNVDPFGYSINGANAIVNGLDGSANVISQVLDVSDPDSNGWRVLSIATSSITGGVANMSSLGIIFYQYVGVDDGIGEIYLDYVKVVSKLATPANLAYASGTLTWDAVANATSYVVKYDGQEYPVATNSIEVASGKSVTVKAVADGYVDSDWSSVFVIASVPDGYIVDYNSSAYESMISDDSGDGYWKSVELTAKYEEQSIAGAENGDAMKLTASLKAYNASQGIAGFKLTFPNEKGANLKGDTIQVRFHAKNLDGTSDVAMFLNYRNGAQVTSGLDITDADDDGWRILNIPVSAISGGASAFSTLGIAFWPYSASSGTAYIYIDYVKVVQVAPVIEVPVGYLADYNTALYESMIKNGHSSKDSYWNSENVSAQYVASDVAGAKDGDALMLTLGVKGGNRVGFQMKFADGINVSGSTVEVRLKAKDGTADVPVFLFSVNDGNPITTGFTVSAADSDGWRTVSIPISAMGGVSADGINLLGLACYSYSTDTTTAIVYIDYVKVV